MEGLQIVECQAEHVIDLLHTAHDDKDIYVLGMFDNWQQYQKWLLDAVYNKNWQVLLAVDDISVLGFLVWNLHMNLYKYQAYLNYIYIGKDFRNLGIGYKLAHQFIVQSHNSSAQRWKWESKVLPDHWMDIASLLPPHDKYTTYTVKRDDEYKEWYHDNFRREKI